MQIVKLTSHAVTRIKQILATDNNIIGLYLAVKKGGCAGMEYDVSALKQDQTDLINDSIIAEQDGVKVYISKKSLLYLIGTEIDFIETKLKTSFVFNNPNQVSACGCGESFLLSPSNDVC